MIEIRPGLEIPDADLSWRTSRAGGPGGQHVNTTDSRVELLFDVAGCAVLREQTKTRLRELAGRRMNAEGILQLICSSHRSQHRNKTTCEERLRELILEALRPPPPPRRPTKPSRSAKRRRLNEKRQRGDTKRGRGKKWSGDD